MLFDGRGSLNRNEQYVLEVFVAMSILMQFLVKNYVADGNTKTSSDHISVWK